MPIIEKEFMELTAGFDAKAFWEENERCRDFSTNKPRCSLSLAPDDHWMFEFMSVPSLLRYYRDKGYRDNLHKETNRVTKEHVGITFFDEDSWVHSPKRIENLFGSEFAYHEGGTPWLMPVTNDPDEFSRVLDRIEKIDLKTWAFPEEFLVEWEERKKAGKPLPKFGSGSRGPATVMTSVIDAETLFLWVYDIPELVRRFSGLLAEKMVEMNRVLREFSGNTDTGWFILDDNCALFNREIYRDYCFPILKQVMDAMAPGDAIRYQHSDSAMGHLLDDQRELGIKSVNYGPTVDVALIREKMPETMINGHMPPFLLRNGSPEEIKTRLIDDFKKAGQTGGMSITTAGSLAAGTGVGRMRWFMKLTQDHCRYD
ncbi:MAG: hypothetical protein NTV93_16205 [Verrucomicrobia bacterium]|nr:hypothetical protein [Verrucomicrobiota bacterium]